VPLTVVPTAYGRPASEALHAAVRSAKRGDPLAPVTVIVPTNSVGVAARRLLASEALGPLADAGRGVVGVTFLTVLRLAELLAAPRLAAEGRRPVSTPVIAAAVRGVLIRAPGLFAPVAEHPATEEALVAAERELAVLDDEALDALGAQHARAHDVVRVHRAVRLALTSRWYDERDLMRTATAVVEGGAGFLADLGTIVCFAPQRWSHPESEVVAALAALGEVVAIVALTGDDRADGPVRAAVGRIGGTTAAETIVPATGTDVFSASDPDDEVRAIVRGIVDAMREGVPLERMAVLFGAADPYARLLHEQLALAGIAHNGTSVRALSDCVLGRALLHMLALPDHDFRRDEVCALFATAPMLDGRGRAVPAVTWERISRRAGVVAGRTEWHARLDAFASEDPLVERLREYVDALANALAPARPPSSWRAFAEWAHGLIRQFLGREARRERWPRFEQDAARRVEATLDRLAGLDTVDRAPTPAIFRRTLELELSTARDRIGRLGDGLLVGSPALALGVNLERLWVCGLAEGVFPAATRDDPLLSDRDRAAVNGDLSLRADRVDDDHRALLAALASTTERRVLSYPRGDLRRSTEHVASRFLEPTLSAIGTTSVPAIASYAHAIARVAFPSSEHELGVRAALAGEQWVGALSAVGRGRELVAARSSDAFTRFDGNLAALGPRLQAVSPIGSEQAISPTQLEQWARCPHAFFVRYVLRVDEVERPEEIMQISPLDRGSLVHQVLDEFLCTGSHTPWTDADRALLHDIADKACDVAEARGLTGRRLLWDRDRRLLHAELDAFLTADGEFRAQLGADTIATELAFGLPRESAAPPVELVCSDGRRLLLRGKADRVDRLADGRLVVIDYKTGRFEPYTGLGPEDPVLGGARLQLPVYAYAARAAFGAAESDVEAVYWFVGRGNDRRIGYAVDAEVDAAFDEAVLAIDAGIAAGCFVARPTAPGPRPFVDCPYCDPDGLGTADRWREWERKYDAPALAVYRALLEEEEEEVALSERRAAGIPPSSERGPAARLRSSQERQA
jgi:RecB family exonuclease